MRVMCTGLLHRAKPVKWVSGEVIAAMVTVVRWNRTLE
jgi:hypothetical protein